jgi:hypothetical protein
MGGVYDSSVWVHGFAVKRLKLIPFLTIVQLEIKPEFRS